MSPNLPPTNLQKEVLKRENHKNQPLEVKEKRKRNLLHVEQKNLSLVLRADINKW